jgi:hypothetical protein
VSECVWVCVTVWVCERVCEWVRRSWSRVSRSPARVVFVVVVFDTQGSYLRLFVFFPHIYVVRTPITLVVWSLMRVWIVENSPPCIWTRKCGESQFFGLLFEFFYNDYLRYVRVPYKSSFSKTLSKSISEDQFLCVRAFVPLRMHDHCCCNVPPRDEPGKIPFCNMIAHGLSILPNERKQSSLSGRRIWV